MNTQPTRAITEEEVQTYQRDGIVVLRGLFDADWVEHLRRQVDEDMARPGPLHQELEKDPDHSQGRFFFDTFLWPRMEGFRHYVHTSPAAQICGRLMASSKVRSSVIEALRPPSRN